MPLLIPIFLIFLLIWSTGTPYEIQQLTKQWEKQRGDLLKRQQTLEDELELVRQAKNDTEQRVVKLERELTTEKEHVRELETTLSTAQQALNECLGKELESSDWVISRDEIHMTDTCLGRGAWGTVVLGRFRGCQVAVKHLHELILSPHNRRLFERQMNIAARCRHPCLLQFIGGTNDDGNPLFVSELMGSSLRVLLQQGPLSHTDISVISLDIAQALNYLHKSKPPIIHRDITSAKVLLWRHGNQWRGKVSGYGTANFMQQVMDSCPGAVIYSSPEALTPYQTVKVKHVFLSTPLVVYRKMSLIILHSIYALCGRYDPCCRLVCEQPLTSLVFVAGVQRGGREMKSRVKCKRAPFECLLLRWT